jgi:aryl-alcohol dehydrogenase-like predicted oxidoreductase
VPSKNPWPGASAHPDVMHTGNSRKNMARAVEDSLRRLQTA